MKAAEIRKQFFRFFESKAHAIVPSAPMVIKDDPSLMFTNAGMNQFKSYFLGHQKPKSSRIANTQKCLRVSGKHNDLEEVGIDTYHHTFFEMLGNWSFGDYFKKEAISWAWELLTEIYKINPESLYITIFEGDSNENLEKDHEAYDIWKEIVPKEKILLGNKANNFWEMGEQGPCGPCSEIHIDLRSTDEKSSLPGAKLVNQDHPQVVEVWNLVFVEFNRKADGSLEQLPQKHVDTGMGFERLCMAMQGKTSNYDTDVFTPLIKEIETLSGFRYGSNEDTDRAIRVISDHIRSVYFAIADGQLPSNNGAGYVIRRILRRAIRYGFTFLNQKDPFIFHLVETLNQQLNSVFPELEKQKSISANVIREEEASFLKTLDQGLTLLDTILASAEIETISGLKAFELYDTFGFPFDLTALIAKEKGFKIDEKGFNKEMAKQKARSRIASKAVVDDWQIIAEDDEEEFVGYDLLSTPVKIIKYRKVINKQEGEFFQLVFNMTPFYPESGGQVGDKGYLEQSNGEIHYIFNTKKENNLIIHYSSTVPMDLNQKLNAVVDENQRHKTACNHSATHLLHQALRSILGDHVEQKGSMVHSGMFRFDFSHFKKLIPEEIKAIEQFVNSRIKEQLPLEESRSVPFEQAVSSGAIALFGEKYGDAVRTIRFGQSVELCGGTHVKNTADIWHFKISSEAAVASGVRRIEAITGEAVLAYFDDRNKELEEVKSLFKNPQDLPKAVEYIQTENSILKKQLDEFKRLKSKILAEEIKLEIEEVKEISFLAKLVDLDLQSIKDLSFELGKDYENLFMVLGSVSGGKAILSCYISKRLVNKKDLDAGKVVRKLGKYIQGSGGGQPFFATAGGKKPEGIPEALSASKGLI